MASDSTISPIDWSQPNIVQKTELNTIKNKSSQVMAGYDKNAQGQYSIWPFMSPKPMRQRGERGIYGDTTARMFIEVPSRLYEKFLRSIKDPDTKKIAEKMAGQGDGSGGGLGYIDWFLQNVTHAFTEKVQISEVLSDRYVAFFFGNQAPVFSYSGMLMNTYQDDWTMRMFRIFRDLGRGTELAKRKLSMWLRYDSMIVHGAMLNFQWSLTGGQEMACPFTFTFLVKKIDIIYGGLTDPSQPDSMDQVLPAGSDASEARRGKKNKSKRTEVSGPRGASKKPAGTKVTPGSETTSDATTGGVTVSKMLAVPSFTEEPISDEFQTQTVSPL